jgi:mannobiose 2-epimerase
MLEASHTIGLESDSRTPPVAKKMVDHALRNGWDAGVGGFYDRGYYFKGAKGITIIDDRKNWWAQAEGVNTLLLMALKYPNDPIQYGARFKTQWQYCRRYLIDAANGGWYEWGLDKEPEAKTGNKAHAWKAAYHDGRSLMNCLQYLRPDGNPPSAPGAVSVAASGPLTVQWKAATDDRQVRGYDIYYGDRRIGFTPLTRFTVTDPTLSDRSRFRVTARDVQGNASPAAAAVK